MLQTIACSWHCPIFTVTFDLGLFGYALPKVVPYPGATKPVLPGFSAILEESLSL